MAKSKKIVVKGGGDNLFKVSVSGQYHFVQKVSVGFISNSYQDMGKTKNLEDALSLIRSFSGREIKEISDW